MDFISCRLLASTYALMIGGGPVFMGAFPLSLCRIRRQSTPTLVGERLPSIVQFSSAFRMVGSKCFQICAGLRRLTNRERNIEIDKRERIYGYDESNYRNQG